MDFDEPRIAQDRTRRSHGRIESLGVADGEDHAGLRGRLNHLIGFGEAARHRFLDQHVDAGSEKRQRDLAMELGRHRKRDGVNASNQVAEICERTRPARGRDLVSARGVGVNSRHELNPRQRGQNPRMMATEITDADDGHSQGHSQQRLFITKTRRHEAMHEGWIAQ